jgi:hypothetical protein
VCERTSERKGLCLRKDSNREEPTPGLTERQGRARPTGARYESHALLAVIGLSRSQSLRRWPVAVCPPQRPQRPQTHKSAHIFLPGPGHLLSSSLPNPAPIPRHRTDTRHHPQDALNTTPVRASPVLPVATVKITSTTENTIHPTHPLTSALPPQVELNFEAIPSSHASSLPPATIPPQDLTVFTTDSQQSPWLPSSSPSLPAQSAQPNFQQPPQQDFVLFDQPARTSANRTVPSPAQQAAATFGSLNTRRQSNNPDSSLQNQRVAQIIQVTGHQTSSSAYTNRFNSTAQSSPSQQQQQQQQFYSSLSAPHSTVALSHQQNSRPARPPVPLFTQGAIASKTFGKMDLQGNSPQTSGSLLRVRSHRLPDALSGLEDFAALEAGTASGGFSSPAGPAYDMHTNMSSASSSASNIGTVSPSDLLIREPFSAPNSSAFTNLTSPSIYNESPEFHDSFNVSPNFGTEDFGTGSNDPWFPLFPPETTVTQHRSNAAAVDDSPAHQSDELDMADAPDQSRRKSANSPGGGHGRHSSVSGVNSRRRDKPLPPIIVDDPSDSIAMKRARNTLAARKSRERKAQRLEDLEAKIAKLEAERDHWKRLAMSRAGSS